MKWFAALGLGPVSGPLFLRANMHWRNGDKVLAGLYGIVILQFWLLLPALTAAILHHS